LPRVEEKLRELQKMKKSGKTIQNYREAICAFCNWCVTRGYLADDPLKHSGIYNTSPISRRRAMTTEEINALLKVAPKDRYIIYLVALTTGLRAGEIRALKVKDINQDFCALNLHSKWTKNRKNGKQPIPKELLTLLKNESKNKKPNDPLLKVPSHLAREMDKDLKNADIPKWTPEGKIDFHACRTAFITFILESGTDLKTAQTLARLSNPHLTLNVYGKTRKHSHKKVVEHVRKSVISNLITPTSPQQKTANSENGYNSDGYLVEDRGFEPPTSALRTLRSPN
jgi:integrase